MSTFYDCEHGTKKNPSFDGSVWSGCCVLAAWFLTLFGKLLFAFFGMDEHIVRVAEFFIPSVSDLAEAVPIVKFKLVQVFKKVLIDFGLQLLGQTGEQFYRFRFEWAGSL